MKRCFLDTNIFLRILTEDDPEKSLRCQNLIRMGMGKELKLYTNTMTIAEIVWTLESYYGCSRSEVREKIEKILNTPNLKVENGDLIAEAIKLYEEKNIDYIDCYNAVYSKTEQMDLIYSYDEDFDRLSLVSRKEP